MITPLDTLQTSGTAWSPLTWSALLLAAAILALFIRAKGRTDRPVNPDAAKPFLSGNRITRPEEARFAAAHLYSGFVDAMKNYYARVIPWHSGRLTDYFLAFLLLLALFLLLLRLSP